MFVWCNISRKRLLVTWVAYVIAGILMWGSFLAGAGHARPATFEAWNLLVLPLAIVFTALAIIYFRKWLRLRSYE
jgi:hypothetical protein